MLFAVPFFVSRPGAAYAEGEAAAKPAWGDTLKVYNHKTDKIMLLDSFDYVVGVVAAEVPATYEPEALKANAVLRESAGAALCRDAETEKYDSRYSENERQAIDDKTAAAQERDRQMEERLDGSARRAEALRQDGDYPFPLTESERLVQSRQREQALREELEAALAQLREQN